MSNLRPASRRRCALVVLVLAVSGCGSSGESSPGADECFRVGYLDITGSAPLFIAEGRGLFDSVSVCIETEVFGTSDQLVEALAADRLDYVVEASAAPALELASRDPTRLFVTAASTISEEEPFDAILVLRSSGIDSLADLHGRRVAVFPGTTASALLRAFLENHGIPGDSVELIPTAPSDQLADLGSGAVDAIHAYEPTWAIGLADTTVVQLFGTVYGRQLAPNPQGVSLLNKHTARERPGASDRLVGAFDRALRIMRQDSATTRATLARHFELPGDAVDRMHLPFMAPHDSIDWSAMSRYAELLQAVDELETIPPIDSLRYVPPA